MALNRDQATNRVLEELFLKPAEQPADSTHHAIAKAVLQECYDELSAREIANWPEDEIPSAVVGPFARYVAAMAAGRLNGVDEEAVKKIAADHELRAIIAVVGRKWSGAPVAVDHF